MNTVNLIWVLLAVMSLDYFSGIICRVQGVSLKKAKEVLRNNESFNELLKKLMILIVVLLASLLDHAISVSAEIEFATVSGATHLWFIASEGKSILKHARIIKVSFPKLLLHVLELYKKMGDEERATNN